MIEIKNATKKFDDVTALSDITTSIEKGRVYGLVGANGAGKSTLLRLLAGVYQPDAGSVSIEGKEIFENNELKQRIAFIPDEPYFLPQSNLENMIALYKAFYPRFSKERFDKINTIFMLDKKRKISNFSKGMKRQAAVVLAMSILPDYLLLDEVFDGLDPVMRMALKKLLIEDIVERNVTAIASSHNLRELEELCDQVGLIHKGGIIFQKDLDDLKLGINKIQLGFKTLPDKEALNILNPLSIKISGNIVVIVAKGDKQELINLAQTLDPALIDILPLTLEEVFINQLEDLGYDIKSIIA